MRISLIYVSHRPGGLDILAGWLAPQETDIKWELVVVDGYPMRVRGGRAKQLFASRKIPLGWYGEPKLRTFPQTSIGYANAVNTGLMRAGGDHFVVVHDFVLAPKDSLACWAASFEQNPRSLVCGRRSWCESSEAMIGAADDMVTWAGKVELTPSDKGPKSDDFQLGYWGGAMELMEECNGLDERGDFCHGWALDDLKAKAGYHGWKLVVDESIPYNAVDHSDWGGPRKLDAHTIYRSLPIPDVPYKLLWSDWSANPFVLREERRTIHG